MIRVQVVGGSPCRLIRLAAAAVVVIVIPPQSLGSIRSVAVQSVARHVLTVDSNV